MTDAMMATMITATIDEIHQLRVTSTSTTHAHATDKNMVDHTFSSKMPLRARPGQTQRDPDASR